MYIEFYTASEDKGVCFKCHAVDIVDGRIQLVEDGPWYFQREDPDAIAAGGYFMDGRGWADQDVVAKRGTLFKLISHAQAIQYLECQDGD